MAMGIFSTYSTGENRITASILAVLRSLSLSRIERILGALLEQPEFELIHFQNQVSVKKHSVPDAAILSSCHLLLETKIKAKSIDKVQLYEHLKQLDRSDEKNQALLVLTPDPQRPIVLDEIPDDRLVWASFATVNQAIEELLNDQSEVISEREAFLLKELQTMFAEENLLGSDKDVVVVAARLGWPKYLKYHAYVCQPRRGFRSVTHLAFYSEGCIQPLIPLILKRYEEVIYDQGKYDKELGSLVHRLLEDKAALPGGSNEIFLLSGPDDPRTIRLEAPIKNDLVSEGGRSIAYTQSQRYVLLKQLKVAKKTSHLMGT